jgi:hypothetical protein
MDNVIVSDVGPRVLALLQPQAIIFFGCNKIMALPLFVCVCEDRAYSLRVYRNDVYQYCLETSLTAKD